MTSGRGGTAGMREGKPVMVGYDGSDESKRAVLWASRYAGAAEVPLVVAHAFIWPYFTDRLGPVAGVEDSGLRGDAHRILAEGLDLARRSEPDLEVHDRMVTGAPTGVLTTLSNEASLLVTGTRGLGGFSGLLIGSVSLHLVSTASCPVMVVRDARPTHDTVLVAVDGSPESDRAVMVATELARILHKSLRLLHVGAPHRDGIAEASSREVEQDPILEQASALLGERAGLTATRDLVLAASVPGRIVEETERAACVVLGAKGGNTLGIRLGSTVHAVLHHAGGNVVVVR
ncbi:universal stress protein [Arthrobacter antioxidans]|uniref:universal stress protein n=1 Tax=Arthrobacter antioxidans TaxID=2895818 RepID=UPI0020002BA1|nr:universal stress protein [Arthrobacter antioxidans]